MGKPVRKEPHRGNLINAVSSLSNIPLVLIFTDNIYEQAQSDQQGFPVRDGSLCTLGIGRKSACLYSDRDTCFSMAAGPAQSIERAGTTTSSCPQSRTQNASLVSGRMSQLLSFTACANTMLTKRKPLNVSKGRCSGPAKFRFSMSIPSLHPISNTRPSRSQPSPSGPHTFVIS